MNRLAVACCGLIFLFIATASCTGRHIEYGGAGPQGGPGYKPTPSEELAISIQPDNLDGAVPEWNFRISIYESGASKDYRVHVDPNLERIASRYGEDYKGTARCLQPENARSASQCSIMHVEVPPIWNSAWHENPSEIAVSFNASISRGCKLWGRFPWEKLLTVWASGQSMSIQKDAPRNSPNTLFLPETTYELQTSLEITDESQNPYQATVFRIDDGRLLDVFHFSLRLPIRSFDLTPVRFAYFDKNAFEMRWQSPGHFKGGIKFFKVPSNELVTADIEIACNNTAPAR